MSFGAILISLEKFRMFIYQLITIQGIEEVLDTFSLTIQMTLKTPANKWMVSKLMGKYYVLNLLRVIEKLPMKCGADLKAIGIIIVQERPRDIEDMIMIDDVQDQEVVIVVKNVIVAGDHRHIHTEAIRQVTDIVEIDPVHQVIVESDRQVIGEDGRQVTDEDDHQVIDVNNRKV